MAFSCALVSLGSFFLAAAVLLAAADLLAAALPPAVLAPLAVLLVGFLVAYFCIYGCIL